MSRTTKIVLIVISAVVLLALLGVGSCVAYLSCLWQERAPEVLNQSQLAHDEGAELGREATAEQCFESALERNSGCGPLDVMCAASSRLYLGGCLDTTTRADVTFCEGAPDPMNIGASSRWMLSFCGRRGQSSNQNCTQLVTEVQRFCVTRAAPRARPEGSNNTQP